MKELMELMKKKKSEGGEMKEDKMSSKLKVLRELRGMANEAIGSDLPSLKKVTVAAPDKEGLEAGLEKAEELVEKSPMEAALSEADEESSELDAEGGTYEEACEAAKMLSPEEKQKLIAELSSDRE